LLVRGVDEAIVRALKERAGEHGQSADGLAPEKRTS
jgi:plasmid stability protein